MMTLHDRQQNLQIYKLNCRSHIITALFLMYTASHLLQSCRQTPGTRRTYSKTEAHKLNAYSFWQHLENYPHLIHKCHSLLFSQVNCVLAEVLMWCCYAKLLHLLPISTAMYGCIRECIYFPVHTIYAVVYVKGGSLFTAHYGPQSDTSSPLGLAWDNFYPRVCRV